MNERACIRGCTVADVHYATCPDFGKDDGACKGCAPRVARDRALICERCYRRLRRMIDEAPDLIGHLRSLADPMKAMAIARNGGRRPEAPAPVEASLLDASDDMMRTLQSWARFVTGDRSGRGGLRAGIATDDAYVSAQGCAEVILDAIDGLVNNVEHVQALSEGVLTAHPQVGEEGRPFWSVADAAARWRLGDTPRWADAACPDCDMRTVKITPARGRRPASYVCTSCDWAADDGDDGGLWRDVFTRTIHPETGETVDGAVEGAAHDDRWLTLTAAARLAKRTPGTVRKWARDGEIKVDLGRYWRPDVEAAVARRDETYGDVAVLFDGDVARRNRAASLRGEWVVVNARALRRRVVPICPECAAGKHRACAEMALDEDDEIGACFCTHEEEIDMTRLTDHTNGRSER